MESLNPKFAPYGSGYGRKNVCARNDTVFFPLSEVTLLETPKLLHPKFAFFSLGSFFLIYFTFELDRQQNPQVSFSYRRILMGWQPPPAVRLSAIEYISFQCSAVHYTALHCAAVH